MVEFVRYIGNPRVHEHDLLQAIGDWHRGKNLCGIRPAPTECELVDMLSAVTKSYDATLERIRGDDLVS